MALSWTPEEVRHLQIAVGKTPKNAKVDWEAVAEGLGGEKTAAEVQAYYETNLQCSDSYVDIIGISSRNGNGNGSGVGDGDGDGDDGGVGNNSDGNGSSDENSTNTSGRDCNGNDGDDEEDPNKKVCTD